MIPVRIIARLDIKGPNVVKGIHLEGLRVVGKPGELARKYYRDGADEIVFMDIVASLYGRNNILDVVSEAAHDVFLPLTVGGGIRTLDDIRDVLRSGADKVAVNTAAIMRPDFIDEAATAFGSQCIVVSVEAKSRGVGTWEALTNNGRETTGVDALDWIVEAEKRGAGEILLTSVDREGTRKGFDLELVERVRDLVRVPVIASGGAGNIDHVAALFEPVRADAACCASIFHYGVCPVSELKEHLVGRGIAVRPLDSDVGAHAAVP